MKMASLPVSSVPDRRDRQMGHADRTLKIARLPVLSGTGRRDNGKGPFFCPLSTFQKGRRKTEYNEKDPFTCPISVQQMG